MVVRRQSLDGGLAGALAGGLALCLATAMYGRLSGTGDAAHAAIAFAAMAAAGVAGIALLWRRDDVPALATLAAIALVTRGMLYASPPFLSRDVYRYVWDGRVLLAGIDPYVTAPDAPVLAMLRTDGALYRFIDWAHVPTLYPPFDLALFTLGAKLDPHGIFGVKLLMACGDLAAIGVLLVVLRRAGLPRGRAALYAWSPLAIVEFAQSGHEEAWAVTFLVLAIATAGPRKTYASALLLAGATLVKLYPLAFLPVLYGRALRFWAVTIAVVALAYLPFAVWNPDIFGFLHRFNYGYHFNDTLHAIAGTNASLVLFAAVLLASAYAHERGAGLPLAVTAAFLGYLLLAPNVYPWYVATFAALVPLVSTAFSPALRYATLGLIAWTFTAPLAYANTFFVPADSRADVLWHVLEYAPLAVGLAVAAFPYVRRRSLALLAALALTGCGTTDSYASLAASPAQVAHGRAVYASQCSFCHTPTPRSFIGPDLREITRRRTFAALQHHLRTAVPSRDGLTAGEARALIAYFATLGGKSR